MNPGWKAKKMSRETFLRRSRKKSKVGVALARLGKVFRIKKYS